MLSGVTRDSVVGTLPETVFVMFQMTFAIITPALMVGAFAERMRFSAMLLFMRLWLTLVYCPGGPLGVGRRLAGRNGRARFRRGDRGAHHRRVAAWSRASSRQPRASRRPPCPPQPGLTVVGAGMLWVGWFGFNAGSALCRRRCAVWRCW